MRDRDYDYNSTSDKPVAVIVNYQSHASEVYGEKWVSAGLPGSSEGTSCRKSPATRRRIDNGEGCMKEGKPKSDSPRQTAAGDCV